MKPHAEWLIQVYAFCSDFWVLGAASDLHSEFRTRCLHSLLFVIVGAVRGIVAGVFTGRGGVHVGTDGSAVAGIGAGFGAGGGSIAAAVVYRITPEILAAADMAGAHLVVAARGGTGGEGLAGALRLLLLINDVGSFGTVLGRVVGDAAAAIETDVVGVEVAAAVGALGAGGSADASGADAVVLSAHGAGARVGAFAPAAGQ